MPEKKERIFWIDLYRILVILLVTINHVPPRMADVFHDWNHYLVITPSFFLSGYCFNSGATKTFWNYFKKKCKTLLRPTLVFFFFFYLLWLLGGKMLAHDEQVEWYKPLMEMAIGRPFTITAPMWYVIALVVMQPIYFLLTKFIPEKYILPISLVVGCVSSILPVPKFWQIDQVLLFMPVYALGARFRKDETVQQIPFVVLLLGCAIGIATFWYCEYDSTPYLLALSPFIMVFTFTFAKVLMCITQWYDHTLPHYKWMSLVGGNTIILLAAQNYVIGVLKLTLDHVLHTQGFLENNAILKMPVGILVIILLYPLVHFIVNHIPWILGKEKKQ